MAPADVVAKHESPLGALGGAPHEIAPRPYSSCWASVYETNMPNQVDAKNAQLALLEDLVIGYLNVDSHRIPSIRDAKDLIP